MDVKVLAIFEVSNRRFEVSGDYEIETEINLNREEYHYPEFSNLSARELVNGKAEDFKPTGTTWAGRKYVVEDMISTFLARLIQNGTDYAALYIDPQLQKLVDEYHKEIAVTANALDIPLKILTPNMYDIYELTLVTNEFIYYNNGDDQIMLRTENHELVSDNYFSSVGFFDSCENIEAGKETILWGELPEDYAKED